MVRKSSLLAALACLLTVTTASAADRSSTMPGPLVTPTWLAAHLDDPDLVLLHVEEREGYDAGHIPHARFVSLDDIALSDHSGKGLILEVPQAAELRDRLAALGIDDRSRIVVYFGKDWVTPATRVLFTLNVAGLGDRSALLDGGLPAWQRSGHAVTGDVDKPAAASTLSPLTLKPLIVDAAFVQAHANTPGYALVDGRARTFYDGMDTGGAHGIAHETGHIVGARSIPFTSVDNDDLALKSPEALRALFDAAGVKPGDTVIGYCHIGQQATAVLLAARLLGHPVLLYDGAFEDWSQRSLPVETAAPSTTGH
jgi:thiosulfate/3-mercaptopyruvate sulfurtransferase